MEFQFNDCGVCENPEIIYSSEGNYNLAWIYYELRICSNSKGFWDYGLSYGGGSSPCMNTGKLNREDVIGEGLALLFWKAKLSVDSKIDINNPPDLVKASKDFLKYYEDLKAPKQLSLF